MRTFLKGFIKKCMGYAGSRLDPQAYILQSNRIKKIK